MKRIITSCIVASTLSVALPLTSITSANTQQNHIAILIDGSSSYGLMHDTDYAIRIANDLIERLPSMNMRDRITIISIGDYSYANPVKEFYVSKQLPIVRVPSVLKDLIESFPQMIRQRGEPKSTNIIGALDKLSRRMDCSTSAGTVFVLSDGAETGQKMTLPTGEFYQGCRNFVMLGLTGRTPAETRQLGSFWNRWCQAAGFASCDWLS